MPKKGASKRSTSSRIGAGGDEIGIFREGGRVKAGAAEIVVREEADGFDAVGEVLPELGGVARAGETSGEADDRDAIQIWVRALSHGTF